MKTKYKTIIIILFIVLIMFLIKFTSAYITNRISGNSIITFGEIKIKLIENEIVNGKEIPVKDGNNINLSNNENISRIVRIENICNHPMFVRIKLNMNIHSNKLEDDASDYISYDISDDWEYKDGWYYYKKELKNRETTSNLITKIMFDLDKITNDYKNSELILTINAEAVQSENNEKNVFDVKGWPSK